MVVADVLLEMDYGTLYGMDQNETQPALPLREWLYWSIWFPIRWRITDPMAALCDAGIHGCELHKRTGHYRPLQERFTRR